MFELFGFELKPKYLVADAAFSISNAFNVVFDGEVIMCWAHCRRAIAKKLSQYIRDKKKKQNEFLVDLDSLQVSRSPEIFEKASQLFIEKWTVVSKDLVEYFKQGWIIQHPKWYEGFAKKTPNSINALESFNRLIKDEQTFLERLDLSQFRSVIFNMIRQWSIEYESNLNSINHGDSSIELEDWTYAYNFARSNTKITSSRHGNRITYSIPLNTDYNDGTVDSWSVFNFFKQSLNLLKTTFKTPVNADNWRNGECDCADFFKKFICVLVIGIALRLKYVNTPVEAKTIPIGQERKRGRPAKAKPALERQGD